MKRPGGRRSRLCVLGHGDPAPVTVRGARGTLALLRSSQGTSSLNRDIPSQPEGAQASSEFAVVPLESAP